MAFEAAGLNYGNALATTDLSLAQYCFVKLVSGGVTTPVNSGEFAFGVLQNNPKLNESANIRFVGITKIVLGATVADAGLVQTDNQGHAIPYASGAAIVPLGQVINGGQEGDITEMVLFQRLVP